MLGSEKSLLVYAMRIAFQEKSVVALAVHPCVTVAIGLRTPISAYCLSGPRSYRLLSQFK